VGWPGREPGRGGSYLWQAGGLVSHKYPNDEPQRAGQVESQVGEVVTCGRLEGWSATKIPMMSPRGLARENARLERTKDFTDRLDWAMFKPETSIILTLKSDGNVKVKKDPNVML
jgi:hypothetical protein